MNILMIVSGLVLVCFGVYRENAPSNMQMFLTTNGPIFTVLCLLLIWAFRIGGQALVMQGVKASLRMASLYAPMLIILIPIMGIGAIIASNYQHDISVMLNGRFGYLGSLGAAFASPSSVALSKFIEAIWIDRVARPQLLYLLTVTPLVSWNILLIRQMGLGWEIASSMYVTNWIVAIGLMVPFWIYGRVLAML